MQPLLHADDQPYAGNALLDSTELDEVEPTQEDIDAIQVDDDFQEIEPTEERILIE